MPDSTLQLNRLEFTAMGCDIALVVESADEPSARFALTEGRALIESLAARLTRFDPESELSRLNRTGTMVCSPELVEVIGHALDAAAQTGGRFDPRIHDALVASGYDRTFATLQHPVTDTVVTALFVPSASGLRSGVTDTDLRDAVRIDPLSRTVSLSAGTHLDLGGIAKGWIADCACELITQIGGPSLVDAGGDIACSQRTGEDPWVIEVEIDVPAGAEAAMMQVALDAGGVATSGVTHRRWIDPVSGQTRHHVIDPRTGINAITDLRTVTVIAERCVVAEAQATSLLIAGLGIGRAEAQRRNITAVLVDAAGEAHMTGDLGDGSAED